MDVANAVLFILQRYPILPKLNHTYVKLIPKKPKPTSMADLYPISLCDAIYKLVTKVISNRLEGLLSGIISDTQLTFTPGRLIRDNIIVAFEFFHAMK